MKLKIDPRLESIVPKLRESDYNSLKNNIKEKGLLKPIDVMSDGTIVDGHHRYKVCMELEIEPLVAIMPNLKTVEEALEYSFDINFARRQLISFIKAEWAYHVLDEKVRKEPSTIRYREAIGAKIGIGGTTYEEARRLIKEAKVSTLEELRNGEISIHTAYEREFNPKEKVVDETFKTKIFAVRYDKFEGSEEDRIAQAEDFFQKADGHYLGRSFTGVANVNKIKASDLWKEE